MPGHNPHSSNSGTGVTEMIRNVVPLNRKSIIVGCSFFIVIFLAFWSFNSTLPTLDNNVAGKKTFQV